MSERESEAEAVQVGSVVEVRIESMANGGAAVARLGSLVLFVAGAAPGERVRVRITDHRRTFARGAVVSVIEPAPERVPPACEYFGVCGGCQWQFLSYPAQLAAKVEIVRDQFRRTLGFSAEEVDGLMLPPIGMVDPWAYRNVITVEPTDDRKPAFHHLHSAALVAIDHCPISQPAISATLAALVNAGVDAETTVRVDDAGAAVAFTPTQRMPVHQSLLGVPFRVSGGAFFQVNTRTEARPDLAGDTRSMADLLAQAVLDGLALVGSETLLDLYAGVGTFSILAAPHARRVIAVEEVPAAATDARYNAHAAGVTNVEVHTRKAEHLLGTLTDRINAVVLDPPRAGCAPPVLDGLQRLRPQRIVYVSCDVATLTRDLRTLQGMYRVESCRLVDLFPQTFHVETVTVLTIGGAKP